MDGCSQMVFCTHLSYAADEETTMEKEGTGAPERRNRTKRGFYPFQSQYNAP